MPTPSRQRSLPGIETGTRDDPTPEIPHLEGVMPVQPSISGGGEVDGKSAQSPQVTEAEQSPLAELAGKTVYVLDAFSLLFQVFHALPEMTSPTGEAVGAVYGFTRDILAILEQKRPDYLFCAFDLPGPTFRESLYEAYKINRSAMPEELVPQIPKAERVLAALGVPVVAAPGYEADDVLATIARICDENRAHCFLVSNDKDCRQLISDWVSVYYVRKNLMLNAEGLAADWGIRPDQVVDFQTLVGDKVDNVPGVPSIGPKGAAELLTSFGTLEGIYDRIQEVKGEGRRKNLLAARDQAFLSRQLVRLERQVPLALDWNAARAGNYDPAQAARLFAEFGFRGFGQKMAASTPDLPKSTGQHYRLVNTAGGLAELVKALSQQTVISVDTETTSIHPRWAELVGISFAWEPGTAYYVPLRGPAGSEALDPQEALPQLRPVLENPDIAKIGQNLKYDRLVLRGAGIELAGMAFDTMIASYLLDAGERSHSLDDLARRFLDHVTIPIERLIGSGKTQRRMDEVPLAEITDYAAEDAEIPLRLRPILESQMQREGLSPLFGDVEMPLVEVLAEMEWTGIRVDRQRLQSLSAEYSKRLDALQEEIYGLAGGDWNIASPKQLAAVLFDKLGLPVVKRTRTGPSTDSDVLAQLAKLHPLPAKIIEFRQFSKLKNTYVDALPEMIHPQTGRIHASYNQVVAATGRLSANDPNLQNIPIRTASGREIRSAFLPQEGWQLLAADYSQIELRVLAHYSQDERLLAAFAADEDIHARVASEVYRVGVEEVTSDMRRAAKAVNFGIIYGQSPFGLAAALDIAQDEAAAFIEAYFQRYPGVEKFLNETLEACAEKGYVTTVLGRRRNIRGVRPATGRLRNLPERTAINTVIQGSAADLIKVAMIRIHCRLKEAPLPARMLLQIHDELIFEVPAPQLSSLASLVVAEMVHVLDLLVPLKVDLKSGGNWAECESF